MPIGSLDELARAKARALAMVDRFSLLAGAAGIVPIPGVDALADAFSLVRMLNKVNAAFQLRQEDLDQLDGAERMAIYGLIAGTGSDYIGVRIGTAAARFLLKRVGAGLAAGTAAKLVPIAGQVASASIGYGIMRYAGRKQVADCHAVCLAAITRAGPPQAA